MAIVRTVEWKLRRMAIASSWQLRSPADRRFFCALGGLMSKNRVLPKTLLVAGGAAPLEPGDVAHSRQRRRTADPSATETPSSSPSWRCWLANCGRG